MLGVLEGFTIIAVLVGVGYLVARLDILPPNSGLSLNHFAFFMVLPGVPLILTAFVLSLRGSKLLDTPPRASAQNMYNYAVRYKVATTFARDIVLLTTLGAMPVILVVSLLLH